MAEGVAARAAAVAILDAVLGEGHMLSDIPEPDLPPSERARAQRLAETVLRHLEPADKLLEKHLRKVPPMTVLNVLRLAVVERAMGAPAHGVVNAAVDIVRRGKRTIHLAGLVNAVLRALPEADLFAGQPPQRLPRWLRQPLVHHYGRDVVTAIELVQSQDPPLDLTLRPGFPAPEGELLPTGSLRLGRFPLCPAMPRAAGGYRMRRRRWPCTCSPPWRERPCLTSARHPEARHCNWPRVVPRLLRLISPAPAWRGSRQTLPAQA